MKIKEITTSQVILFQYDEIPQAQLLIRSNADQLLKKFEFTQAEIEQVKPNPPIIRFNHGVVRNGEQRTIVDALAIEERRILFAVKGPTEAGDNLLKQIIEELASVANQELDGFLEPILIAHETNFIGNLDFNADKLIALPLHSQLLTEIAEAGTTKQVRALPKIGGVHFVIDYSIEDKALHDYKISPSRKQFAIEPRKGFPIDARIYSSVAPFPSSVHLKILEGIESLLMDS